MRGLGANEVIDYTKADFAELLSGYDVVLDSLGGDNLMKSLTVLEPGGLAISVVGPPDAAFAEQVGRPLLKPVMAFFFMRADGGQLRTLAARYDRGALRPVVDRTFPFDATLDALAVVEQGRAKGKIPTFTTVTISSRSTISSKATVGRRVCRRLLRSA